MQEGMRVCPAFFSPGKKGAGGCAEERGGGDRESVPRAFPHGDLPEKRAAFPGIIPAFPVIISGIGLVLKIFIFLALLFLTRFFTMLLYKQV